MGTGFEIKSLLISSLNLYKLLIKENFSSRYNSKYQNKVYLWKNDTLLL